ncbi:major facilitator superfamily protein mfs4 [Gelatoporia subvermispora B]|uniref:Major facilitator superfamily protein mfs4 n=1 Tax=Ceriporiopsis subvermispora (strain B) TaxID=914234 RepID=M2QY57_CERS8|nr:major facilitator superfamily protein mfs4 [Gelatoporia subvermispora B]
MASGRWTRMSFSSALVDEYDVGDGDLEGAGYGVEEYDSRTPLDRTIDRIGMGSYQWTLLSLCGFGWMADNMWIQAIAIVLPRVQQHFAVRDSYIGTLSSSMFAGMMFGAVGWGTCSDLMGRTTAFNATLFLTSVFGVFASLVNSFTWLCIALFLLGSAVGGSMPTDGTLLLEHMPNGKQYLVTALSVFFSFGAVLAAIVGLVVIPGHSCPPAPAPCDVGAENQGWKYLLMVLGLLTLFMFLARMVFFRLHESPRYLVHAGRPQEAIDSLQMISKFNGEELALRLDDVEDRVPASSSEARAVFRAKQDEEAAPGDVEGDTTEVVFDADRSVLPTVRSHDALHSSPDRESMNYSSTGESNTPLDGHAYGTPAIEHAPYHASTQHDRDDALPSPRTPSPPSSPHLSARLLPPESPPAASPRGRPHLRTHTTAPRRASTVSVASLAEVKSRMYWKLPRWFRRPLYAWLDRVAMVLSPEWFRTTVLMWAAWCGMSLAYTMFNVYLPKLLETRSGAADADGAPRSLTDSLWDVVIYALGGCPGALLGAYLIESRLGRRWSLAGSTFVTAFFCWVFVVVEHPWAVRASTVGISLSATAMWAVLYGWTPEIFGTKVRGTACGIASALSRIGGMIAPMLGGKLLTINHSVPVYASIVIFIIAGVCVLLLDVKETESGGERVLVH